MLSEQIINIRENTTLLFVDKSCMFYLAESISYSRISSHTFKSSLLEHYAYDYYSFMRHLYIWVTQEAGSCVSVKNARQALTHVASSLNTHTGQVKNVSNTENEEPRLHSGFRENRELRAQGSLQCSGTSTCLEPVGLKLSLITNLKLRSLSVSDTFNYRNNQVVIVSSFAHRQSRITYNPISSMNRSLTT